MDSNYNYNLNSIFNLHFIFQFSFKMFPDLTHIFELPIFDVGFFFPTNSYIKCTTGIFRKILCTINIWLNIRKIYENKVFPFTFIHLQFQRNFSITKLFLKISSNSKISKLGNHVFLGKFKLATFKYYWFFIIKNNLIYFI